MARLSQGNRPKATPGFSWKLSGPAPVIRVEVDQKMRAKHQARNSIYARAVSKPKLAFGNGPWTEATSKSFRPTGTLYLDTELDTSGRLAHSQVQVEADLSLLEA